MMEAIAEIRKLTGIDGIEKTIEQPPDPGMGDLASTICFELAKKEKAAPQKIAQRIASQLAIPRDSLISRVEASGGYLNFFLNYQKVARAVIAGLKTPPAKKLRIMVEHTSVNPNKALHIGHCRNSCLGDSLARMLRFAGNDVQTANYIDDSGAQVADIIVGFKFLGMPVETDMKFDAYCGNNVYVKVNKRYAEDESLKEKRGFIIKKIEEGGNETAKFSETMVDRVVRAQLQTLWRLGVSFDLLNHETDIMRLGLWDAAFEMMKKKGVIYHASDGPNRGCWLLRLSGLTEFKGLENPDKVLVRSDGTLVYTAKDIAYAMWKHGLLDADFAYARYLTQPDGSALWRTTSAGGEKNHPKFGDVDASVNVIDVRQSYAQDVVAAALKLVSGGAKNYMHYDYETVLLSARTAEQLGIADKVVQMSGRKGWFVNADDVLDRLADKAYAETKSRNPDAPEEWVRDVAEKVAVGALRYELTKIDSNKSIAFDMEDSLKLEGNTGPYLQYSHARAKRITEKARRPESNAVPAELNGYEKNLTALLYRFSAAVEKAAGSLAPQEICKYAYDLATSFNKFYQECPVIQAEGATRDFRLALVSGFLETMKASLDMIGMPAPDKM